MRSSKAWLIGTLLLFAPSLAHAHPLAPIALWVDQDGAELILRIKRARLQPTGAVFAARLPPGCEVVSPAVRTEESSYVIEQSRLRCSEPLVGARFGVDGLSEAGVDAVVRVTLADGRVTRGLLDRSEDVFVVPASTTAIEMAESFGGSGFAHLLGGFDHILLVIGLVLLLRRPRKVLLALTAFTIGHALSMFAAALGWIDLPGSIAEVAIALTLIWLAWEVVRERDGGAEVRRPYLASLAVGLVHGLGFAAAFSDAGVTGADLWLALGSFHIGIELGQLAIVLAALVLMRLAEARRESAAQLAGYAIGAIAFMWLIERAVLV